MARVQRISPLMVRVTLTGPDLAGFSYAAPADHVKLVFPGPGQEEPLLPQSTAQGPRMPDGAPPPTTRDYTVRYHRPDVREVDIDFALPGDGHPKGPASSWAAAAVPGRRIGVLGPRGSHLNPYDFDWYLFAGDETALPAIGAWLEQVPPGAVVYAFGEVANEQGEQVLAREVQWLHRDRGASLEAALATFERPAGEGYVWVAGEATALKPIRRALRGWGVEHVKVDGYWKRGVANHDHHATDDD